jgi:hypothetical protein
VGTKGSEKYVARMGEKKFTKRFGGDVSSIEDTPSPRSKWSCTNVQRLALVKTSGCTTGNCLLQMAGTEIGQCRKAVFQLHNSPVVVL